MIDQKLLTLITLSKTESFSRAAKELNLTQPAVSNHIKLLEQELGCELFIRNNNQAKMTEEGKIALHYARRIEAIYAKLDQKILDYKSNKFSLTIGITHTAQSSPIVDAITQYAASKGNIHINFITGLIKNLYEELDEYLMDIAIVEGQNEDPSFDSILLDTDTLLVAVSSKNELSKKSFITLEELRKQKLILRSKGSATRDLFEASLASHNSSIQDFNILVESESLSVIKDLVIKNDGISILAQSSCTHETKKGKLVLIPIMGLPMTRTVNIVTRKGFKRTDILEGIIEQYKKVISNI